MVSRVARMSRVVVVGGGFGGTAAAARLAKQGHDVTLVERRDRLGGALGFVERDGFRWDAGPTATALPAVAARPVPQVRTAPRARARPGPRGADARAPLRRRHASSPCPSGSRAAQLEAVEDALGAGLGRQWVDYVHGFADTWDVLRRVYLERP